MARHLLAASARIASMRPALNSRIGAAAHTGSGIVLDVARRAKQVAAKRSARPTGRDYKYNTDMIAAHPARTSQR
jgi:hypothetical protein